MKFEEKFKNLFPDMKKGIGRFPVTVIFSLILFIVAIFTIESDFYILPEEDLWIKYLIIAIPLSASVELLREKYLENKRSNFFRITIFFGIFLFIFLYS